MGTHAYTNNTPLTQVVHDALANPLIVAPGETVSWEDAPTAEAPAAAEYRYLAFTIPGTLAVGQAKAPSIVALFAGAVKSVYAYVRTAPVGANLIIDIHKNGATIWSTQGNRMTVVAGQNTAEQETVDNAAVAEYDRFDIDIDQIGSGTAGADLTVEMKIKVS